jgi:hypothetical protein
MNACHRAFSRAIVPNLAIKKGSLVCKDNKKKAKGGLKRCKNDKMPPKIVNCFHFMQVFEIKMLSLRGFF